MQKCQNLQVLQNTKKKHKKTKIYEKNIDEHKKNKVKKKTNKKINKI